MDWLFGIVVAIGDFIAWGLEAATGIVLAEATQKAVGYAASIVGLLAGLAALWKFLRSGRDPTPATTGDVETLKSEIATLKAELLAELKGDLADRENENPGGTGTSGDGLERDLAAAVDTALAQGHADVLKDKSGRALEAEIDRLIAERATARGRVAKDEAALWRQKGALAFLHDTQSAIAAYRRATDLDPDDADGWNQLGHLLRRAGDLGHAEAAYERVLALGNRSADKATIAKATGNLGLLYDTRGDLDKAEQMYTKSLELHEALGRKEGMANQYGNLGILYRTRGDLDKAEQMYTQSLELNEALGRKEGMADQYTNFGILYATRGDLDKAEQMYTQSLELNEALGRKEGMASDYGNLGNLYRTRGDLDKAEQMYTKSLEIEEALGRKEGMASDYGNLGILYEERGDMESAVAYWRKARDLYSEIGIPHQVKKHEGWLRDAGEDV